MTAADPPRRMVRCPKCGAQALWAPENPWRPFCSERCRLNDLGAWASGEYRVPGSEPDPGTGDEKDS